MVDVNRAVALMREMCDSWSLGYSQPDRWDIRPGGSADCSSSVAYAYNKAGISPPFPTTPHAATYTGSFRELALARGFTAEAWDWHDDNDLTPGDLLLSEAASGGVGHIAMYVGDDLVSEAWINEIGDIEGGAPGDQTGQETHTGSYWRHPYTVGAKWTHVLYPPRSAPRSVPKGGMLSTGQLDFSDAKRLTGVDVSNHQPNFDPREFPGDFVIVLATEGAGFTNPDFEWQYDTAREAGKLVGAYHFARNGWNSPEDEAEYFLSVFGDRVNTGVIVLDWEDGGNTWDTGWAKRWLDYVKAKTGQTPLVYMSQSVAVSNDWSAVAPTYPLWLAHYGLAEDRLYTPDYSGDTGAWKRPTIWQYTDTGRAGGYVGDLDLNVGYLTATQWLELAGISVSNHRKGNKKMVLFYCHFKEGVRYFLYNGPALEWAGQSLADQILEQWQGRRGAVQVSVDLWNKHLKPAALHGINLDANYALTEHAVLKDLLAQQKRTNELLAALAKSIPGALAMPTAKH